MRFLLRLYMFPGFACLIAAVGILQHLYSYSYSRQNSASPGPGASSLSHTLSSLFPPFAIPSSQQMPAVIIVGSGLAGLSAALGALRADAPAVLLLEYAPNPGGNSLKASSGINGAPTRFQAEITPDNTFFSDTVKSAGRRFSRFPAERRQRERLIALLTSSSGSAVNLLADEVGVDLSVVSHLGGHSTARTHRGAGKTPPGIDIVTKLLGKLQQDSRFEIKTGCEVTKLLALPQNAKSGHSPVVTGVEYRSGNNIASATGPVVFATGGFAGDADGLLAEYRPDLAGLPSTNDRRPGMHGLLTDVGAKLVDMDSVQIHPTGFVDPANPHGPLKYLAAEMLRGEGGILLHQGRRFVNELGTREHISRVITGLAPSSANHKQWDIQILLDPGACSAAASHVAFYIWRGLLTKKKIFELDDATRETIRAYSLVAAGEQHDEFGRGFFGHWNLRGGPEDVEQDVCVGNVTPAIHFTMGGVAISEKAEVLSSTLGSEHQVPIRGLWAAGEVTGGMHGDNRLGGSSLLECVVFGRIAGEAAAAALRGSRATP